MLLFPNINTLKTRLLTFSYAFRSREMYEKYKFRWHMNRSFTKKSALVQVIDLCQADAKPLPEPIMMCSMMHICMRHPAWKRFLKSVHQHMTKICVCGLVNGQPVCVLFKSRPVLQGFVVTMHEGACKIGSPIPRALARWIGFAIWTSPSTLWQQNLTDQF